MPDRRTPGKSAREAASRSERRFLLHWIDGGYSRTTISKSGEEEKVAMCDTWT
jgi:hypothetical protein